MWRRDHRNARGAFAVCMAFSLAGCAVLDHSLSPRTYSVNESADAVLNDTILLNIVRASYDEPLNFVAIAKYTANAQLTAGAQGTVLYATGTSHPQASYGPLSGGAQATNSFDLNVLETKDFYNGLLHGMDGQIVEAWFLQGLPHELVFYTLLDSIRVTFPNGDVVEYRNDPTDDQWTEAPRVPPEYRSPKCAPVIVGPGRRTNYGDPAQYGLWVGVHADDCRFQKFRFFVDLAVKYGVRQESQQVPNPKWTKASTTEPKTIAKMRTCYDPAIARENVVREGGPRPPLKSLLFTICGSKDNRKPPPFNIGGPGILTSIEFKYRSAFAIFQYLGRVLASQPIEEVVLNEREAEAVGRVENPRVLNIVTGAAPDCFADAWYRGVHYCVPEGGSENTKRIFTLLRAMLAINIAATDLNPTPTVRVTP